VALWQQVLLRAQAVREHAAAEEAAGEPPALLLGQVRGGCALAQVVPG
jgi:hypothetical protein